MPRPIKYVPISLSGDQWGRLSEALQDAFPSWDELRIFVRQWLDVNLATVSAQHNPISTVTFDMIQFAQSRGLGGNLVAATRLARPGHPRVQAVAQELLEGDLNARVQDQAPKPVTGRELERIVKKNLKFDDALLWWKALGETLPRVCQVKVDLGTRAGGGTGFLVGPDVVLTNHHVVQAVLDDPRGGAKVRCVFDFQRVRGSTVVVNPGFECALADEWIIDSSPPSPLDSELDTAGQEPADDALDYALLRLAEPIADRPVGDGKDPNAPKRGYISIASAPATVAVGAALYIVQHPDGQPLQVALDTDAVLSTNRTRVRYRTNTLPGSSGSPCFDAQWNPVALHHAGDPNFAPSHQPLFNQGILLAAIVARLKRLDKLDEIGA